MGNEPKYSKGQKVKVIKKINECGDAKYLEHNKYLGKIGIVVQSGKIGFGGVPGTQASNLPESAYIYTINIDGVDVVLSQDILQAVN